MTQGSEDSTASNLSFSSSLNKISRNSSRGLNPDCPTKNCPRFNVLDSPILWSVTVFRAKLYVRTFSFRSMLPIWDFLELLTLASSALNFLW